MSRYRSAIARGVDMTGFDAVMTFTVGTNPAISITPADVVHRDPLNAANGRGSFEGSAIIFSVEEYWTGAGNIVMGIDANGLVYFESDTESFALSGPDVLQALGFPGDVPVVVGAAPFRATAYQRPVPGPFKCATGLRVDPTVAAAYVVCAGRWYPNPITAMRSRGIDDIDDFADSLEQTIHNASASLRPVTVGLDDLGRTVIAWPSSLVLVVAWVDSANGRAFRNIWGFRGDEVPVDDGSVVTLTASRMHPSIQVIEYGFEYMEPRTRRPADAHGKRAGGHVTAERGSFDIWSVEFKVEGPDGNERDDHLHLLRRALPAMGKALNIYPIWGEPRRALEPYMADVDTPPHSLLHTTRPVCVGSMADDGYGGRAPGELALDNREEIAAAWNQRDMRVSADVALTIEVVADAE